MNQLPVEKPPALRGLSTKAGIDAMVLSTVSFALAMGAVGLRYWAKCIIKRKWTDHDWLILVSLIFAAGYYVGGVASLYPGLVGMHIQNAIMLGPGPIQLTFKLFYASKFTWVTTTTLTKLSMLHFYRGIFQKDRVQDLSFCFYRWGAVTIYAASVLFWFIHIIMGFAECKPLALEWDKTLPGSCLDVKKQEIADTTTNAIFDFSIMVLPLPILWSLNLPFKKKAGITVILSFALIINAANIARLIFILKGDPIDFTYEAAKIGTAAALEINVGITCACLPTLGPIIFLRRTRESQKPKYLYSRSGSSKWRKVRDPDDSILKSKGGMTTYDDEVALRDLEDQRSFGQEPSPRI